MEAPAVDPAQIAKVNDFIRNNIFGFLGNHKKLTIPGADKKITVKVLMTVNVSALPPEKQSKLLEIVSSFQSFTKDNDPHEEHDFGSVMMDGTKYFFKFDYYDDDFEYLEENGNRVLTIMEASEY